MALSPFYDIERPFRLLERQFWRPEEMFNFNPFSIMPRDFFAPQQFYRPWDNFVRPMEQLASAMNQLALDSSSSIVSDDNNKFQVSVDVHHFAPEEITVRVDDGVITVQGKHEEKKDEHGYISRQFVRKYALPQGCLPDTVKSNLSSDGVLTVSAPKVLPLPSTGERIVPITYTGPVQKIRSPN